jgi:hypothetical protein
MRGVSATVMMGQHGYYGTNAFNLVLDLKEMENLDTAVVNTSNVVNEIDRMFGIMKIDDNVCSKSNIEIKNNISTIKHQETEICDDEYNIGF